MEKLTYKKIQEANVWLQSIQWKDELNKLTAIKNLKVLKPLVEETSQKLFETKVRLAIKGKNGLVEKDKETGDFNFTEESFLKIEDDFKEYLQTEVEVEVFKLEKPYNQEIKDLSVNAMMALDGIMIDI